MGSYRSKTLIWDWLGIKKVRDFFYIPAWWLMLQARQCWGYQIFIFGIAVFVNQASKSRRAGQKRAQLSKATFRGEGILPLAIAKQL